MSALIDELKVQRTTAYDAAKDLKATSVADERDMTEDERLRYARFMAEFTRLSTDIKEHEELEAAASVLDEAPARTVTPDQPGQPALRMTPRIEMMRRHGPLRGFRTDEDAYHAGKWLRAKFWGDTASRDWCIARGMEMRAGNEAVGSKGGFVVPDQLSQAIIDLREEYGVVAKECQHFPMASDHMVVPWASDGLTPYAIGENAAITSSDLTWSNITLTAHKWGVLAPYSTELAEDAIIDIASRVADEIARAFAKKLDDTIILGDGTATYHGMWGFNAKMETAALIDTWPCANQSVANDDDFVELTYGGLLKAVATLPAYALDNAKWYCSATAKALVFERLALALGGAGMRESEAAGQPTFLGYPIVVTQSMPTTTTVAALDDKVMLLFGDMRKACAIGTRRDVTIALSTDYAFNEDQITLRGTTRFDVNISHGLGTAAACGPMCAVVGQT